MQTSRRTPVLELQDVAIRYGGNLVVSGASFHVDEGEFITLLGPSGSGKTSLLRAVAGFVPASAGRVLLRGNAVHDVPPHERDVGMVFQNYALFPHMTIAQNLSFGPRMMKIAPDEIRARASEALAQVRLERFVDRYPHELSGGQQQRAAIARALAMRPSLLLLDEPMSNLDARLRAEMRVELVALLKRLRMTAVAVTHNQEEALAMSDRIVVMSEGAIRQAGTPDEIYMHPADAFVAGFVGDANVIDASHDGFTSAGDSLFRTGSGTPIAVAGDPGVCRRARQLLVRPEAIRITGGHPDASPREGINCFGGRLLSAAYMGAYTELRAQAADMQILVKLPASSDDRRLAVGDPVTIQWATADVRALLP
ncbi:MAG TPA: ABC transporter ATP-binding protein [Ramlibacter sp.]|uniref:ABC transporter ATP-binding protein n=1 Tax=Ramlibacter sp. TaxID=1917967 RepID=UPI002C8A773E|nr:ABC transporter ATP-binding protein [Ramlibacter sp.]HVZ45591.1 ABC transporter ATP-binding protein [Ramlibacter sp.]